MALGLSLPPKVHKIEDRVAEQYSDIPFPLFFCIKEFLEQNHQIGHEFEGKKNKKCKCKSIVQVK
jgi:hypothetical protein